MADIVGRIHSTESFGTVDGPGLRFIIFMQGCPMRCIFCHNPDSWDAHGGSTVTADELLAEYRKNKDFYTRGGITVTGGEPLLQMEFVTELFRLAKQENIHTCIDTSGITFRDSAASREKFDELMKHTDLVMLDIKHIDTAAHKKITGVPNDNILAFAKYLEEKNVPLWIRHVVIEGYTDSEDDLYELGSFIGRLKNLRALDVLPYHTLGKAKYAELGIDYPLGDLPALSKDKALAAKSVILRAIKDVRGQNQ